MEYKLVLSNDVVKVIDVDGEKIQLSADIDIEGFLKSRNIPAKPVKKKKTEPPPVALQEDAEPMQSLN